IRTILRDAETVVQRFPAVVVARIGLDVRPPAAPERGARAGCADVVAAQSRAAAGGVDAGGGRGGSGAARRGPRRRAWIAPDGAGRAQREARAGRNLADPNPPAGFYRRDARTAFDHPLMAIELEEHFEFSRRLGVGVV